MIASEASSGHAALFPLACVACIFIFIFIIAVDVELECLGNIGFGFDVRVTIEFPTGCAAEAKEGPASAPPIYSM